MFSSDDKRLLEKLKGSFDIKVELERLLQNVKSEIETLRNLQSAFINDYETKRKNLAKTENLISDYNQEVLTEIDKIIAEKTQGFPWLNDAISQYFELQDLGVADYLDQKKWAAKKAAETIREISKQKTSLRKKFLHSRNLIKYYEALFPWLPEYVGEDIDELLVQIENSKQIDDDSDPVRKYLPAAEYKRLSVTERNQKALDRYWLMNKSSWQIGRDYERYIGYLYEKDGYSVYYQGIERGLEDLGRDLICMKDNQVVIVQCKYWKQEKIIHEKHINQLFGTTVEYFIKNYSYNGNVQMDLFPSLLTESKISGTIITSASLSETARAFASVLGIKVIEQFPFEHYPSIKCNVSRKDNSKIYHLPFDQQYDKTIIEEERNECYVQTVKEAEKLGFRRAWKWRGND